MLLGARHYFGHRRDGASLLRRLPIRPLPPAMAVSLAYRADAKLMDMEFGPVPSNGAFYAGERRFRFLFPKLSGARGRSCANQQGKPFMNRATIP